MKPKSISNPMNLTDPLTSPAQLQTQNKLQCRCAALLGAAGASIATQSVAD
jgi:hypothetical protein